MLLSDRIILGDTILERINLRLVQFLSGVISKRKKINSRIYWNINMFFCQWKDRDQIQISRQNNDKGTFAFPCFPFSENSILRKCYNCLLRAVVNFGQLKQQKANWNITPTKSTFQIIHTTKLNAEREINSMKESIFFALFDEGFIYLSDNYFH